MTARSSLRLLGTAGLLTGASAVLVLGATLVRHVAGGAHGGLALFAWAASLAVALPVMVTLAAALVPVLHGRGLRAVIPNAGWKIPGAGQ